MKLAIKLAIQKTHSVFLGTLLAFLLTACASVDRVEYPISASPAEEVSKLDQEMNEAVAAQHDVLAPKEIKRGQKHLKEAKEELADGDLDDFWDELGMAQAYLNKAEEVAAKRAPKVQAVLDMRQKAIEAGARRHSDTRDELGELDESFKKNARELDRDSINEARWERTLINYGALHVNTVRDANLGEARSLVRMAKKNGARTYAPSTLREAEASIDRAERAIALQPENTEAYEPLTTQANEMARTLVAVNATSRQASGQTNEEVARAIVNRNRALSSMQAELQGADAEATLARRALASEAEWNKALQEARAEFSEDEAELYRQGDQLLIRLKKINFPVGGTEVPEQSKDLLTKVSTVIEELNARNVEVQGHTDATGSPKVNKAISEKRAASVADFLESEVGEADVEMKTVGYGFEKPIAANRSKEGRAINRRVDIVITPTRVGASEQDSQQEKVQPQ